MTKAKIHEKILFRLIAMPCCCHLLCWVNPRLPNFCPECGKKVFMDLRQDGSHTRIRDEDAVLSFSHE